MIEKERPGKELWRRFVQVCFMFGSSSLLNICYGYNCW